MRLTSPAAALAVAALVAPAFSTASLAQTTQHGSKGAAAQGGAGQSGSSESGPGKSGNAAAASQNPVVATVNGDPVHLDDVRAAAQSLPEDMRNMPPGMLFPMIVNQVIDQKALLIAARKEGLQKDPSVQKVMQAASDTALQNVYLTRAITPVVTDQV